MKPTAKQPLMILDAILCVSAKGELLATNDGTRLFLVDGLVESVENEHDETNIHPFQETESGMCSFYKSTKAITLSAPKQETETPKEYDSTADDIECVEDLEIDGKGCMAFLLVCFFVMAAMAVTVYTAFKGIK